MRVPGEIDSLYVTARRVLLDALSALGIQRQALVLIGAQAIYLHTGDGDLAVAPFTSDADIAVDPSRLQDDPTLTAALEGAGFERTADVGMWAKRELAEDVRAVVTVDFLVPESLGGGGRRGARLGVHGNQVARKARGLEPVLVDKTTITISAFESHDHRRFEIAVAGPAALLVSKIHKLHERVAQRREVAKDALDVLRLLRATPTATLAKRIKDLLADPRSEGVTREALRYLDELFGRARARGSQLAAAAASPLEDADTIAQSCEALASDLLTASAR
jgi:nucleotidyltransferase-like protein